MERGGAHVMKSVLMLMLILTGCPAKKPTTPEDPKPADAGVAVGEVALTPDAAAPVVPKVDPWCANRPEKAGPFLLDAALTGQRRGTAAAKYSDVEATKEQPIEVCGLEGARKWLESTRCPDGSVGVQGGRFDSIGLGGRCTTMIERFKVGCPDGALNIVFAVHFCGPGESM